MKTGPAEEIDINSYHSGHSTPKKSIVPIQSPGQFLLLDNTTHSVFMSVTK